MNTAVLNMSQDFRDTAGFDQKQAETLAAAIYKSREDLATKEDLGVVKKDLEEVKEELKTKATQEGLEAVKKDLEEIKEELKTKASKEDLDNGLKLVKAELRTEIGSVRTEVANVRTEVEKVQSTTIYVAILMILSVLGINAYFDS